MFGKEKTSLEEYMYMYTVYVDIWLNEFSDYHKSVCVASD